jgi:glycogen debranching enzyme
LVFGGGSHLAGSKPNFRCNSFSGAQAIFDAEPPYTPRGCCAQAWSVAEAIRVAMVIESTRGD